MRTKGFKKIVNPGSILVGKEEKQLFIYIGYANETISMISIVDPKEDESCFSLKNDIKSDILQICSFNDGFNFGIVHRLLTCYELYNLFNVSTEKQDKYVKEWLKNNTPNITKLIEDMKLDGIYEDEGKVYGQYQGKEITPEDLNFLYSLPKAKFAWHTNFSK